MCRRKPGIQTELEIKETTSNVTKKMSAICENLRVPYFKTVILMLKILCCCSLVKFRTVSASNNYTCSKIINEQLLELKGCTTNKTERGILCTFYSLGESSHVFKNVTEVLQFVISFSYIDEYNVSSGQTSYLQKCVGLKTVVISKFRGNVDESAVEFSLPSQVADLLAIVLDFEIDIKFPGDTAVGVVTLNPDDCKDELCSTTMRLLHSVFAYNKKIVWDIHLIEQVKKILFERLHGRTEFLRLSGTLTGAVSTVWLKMMEGLKMFKFDAHGNTWYHLPAWLPSMPELQSLDLSECQLSSIAPDNFEQVANIREINLSRNNFTEIPEGLSKLTNLQVLKISGTMSNKFTLMKDRLKDLKKLVTLDMSYLPLKSLSTYSLSKLPNLLHLNLSNCGIIRLDKDTFSNLSLTSLDLSRNLLHIVDQHTFASMHYGGKLYLSWNKFTKGQKLLIDYLELLDFSGNSLTSPADILSSGRLELLHLAFNKIIDWSVKSPFKGNSYEILKANLSHNLINYVSSVMGKGLNNLHSVDLGGNPFNCKSCGLLEFKTWLSVKKIVIFNLGLNTSITCALPSALKGLPIVKVAFDKRFCLPKPTNYIVVLGIPTAVIFTIGCISLILGYVYRFEITYIHHLLKAKRRKKKIDTDNGIYAYDAFVAYSGEDQEWVLGDLLKNMENEEDKYQLCLHQRDFRLGSFIMENAVECIDKSRKVILVLSKNFIDSEWCRWEVRMVNHRLFEHRENFVVLIELERLDKASLPLHLRCLMDTITYLEWFSEKEHHPVFWQRLKDALGPSLKLRQPEGEEDDLSEDT